MPNNAIGVQILGDSSSLERAFKRSERSAVQFNGRMNALGQASRGALSRTGGAGGFLFGSGTFIAAAGITAAITKSVSAASDLNETISKSRQVFGEASVSVERFGDSAAQALGQSKQQAVEAAATFGNLFRTVGLAGQQNAEFSTSLVKLAGDLASFNNVAPGDALLALRSGLIGEAEPLRRFGVLLSEARVQQVALAESGKKSVKALTDQEKVLARYKIILDDTATAQGDFERTSGGLANQTRILTANLSNLAANLGSTFLPAINPAIKALNDVFETSTLVSKVQQTMLDKIHESGLSFKESLGPLQAYRDGIASLKGESDKLVVALDAVIAKQRELAKAQPPPAALGPSADTQDAAAQAIRRQGVDRKRLVAENARIAKQFAESIKGLGLKLDKAQITSGLDDDLKVLREIEARIQRQIGREGKTFKLVEQLTQIRAQIATTEAAAASEAANASRDAFSELIDSLNLNLEVAQATKGFKDDLAALKSLETVILQRIKAEGRTTELLRLLFENRQEQADTQRKLVNAQQFTQLGLTESGEKITPSVNALKKRLASVKDSVKGTVLDTAKTRTQLANIGKVLSGQFGAVGKEVRDAILQMLNDITRALESGGGKIGQLTKTTSLNTNKVLKGIQLTPEQERLLKARLSNFNSGGVALAAAQDVGSSGGKFVVESHTTVNLDGEKVGKTVTRHQQKAGRRNPRQKRGPHRKN